MYSKLFYCFFPNTMVTVFSAQAPHFRGVWEAGGPKILKHAPNWCLEMFLESPEALSLTWTVRRTGTKDNTDQGGEQRWEMQRYLLSLELPVKGSQSAHLISFVDLKWFEDISRLLIFSIHHLLMGMSQVAFFRLASFKRAPQKCLASREALTNWSDIFRYLEDGGGP